MANQDLGTKRVCADCGAKFYDLNKNPTVCPKCGHEEAVTVAKPRRKPVEAPVVVVKEKKPEPVAEDENDVTVGEDASLEELAAKELAEGEDDVDEALLPSDDDAEADPFLPDDDDDDDDVSTLVPGVGGGDD